MMEEGLARSSNKQHSENTTSGIFVKQVVFLTVNHRGPLPFRELHSTAETIVWRDPGGSWACLPPVYKCNHLPQSVTHVDYAPNSTIRREEPYETLKDQNHKKKSWVEEVYEKDPKRKYSEWREPYEMLNRRKPLTNNNSWAEEGQRKSTKINQPIWKGAHRKPPSE